MKKLIFTDLDGTLLDLHTYSARHIKNSVEKLKKKGFSIIFCSSKTWSEQEFYLNELQLNEPVIVENGSGIFFPDDTDLQIHAPIELVHGKKTVVLGKKYDEVLSAIEKSSKEVGANFKCYHNQTIDEIARITGLSIEGAAKANRRDFSETLFNVEKDSTGYKLFKKDIESYGYLCLPGSKFITICGAECDKGKAVKLLIDTYRQHHPEIVSYGIGDSRNDQEMLGAVDYPYLVQKPDQSWAKIDVSGLRRIEGVGPQGWNMMAEDIL